MKRVMLVLFVFVGVACTKSDYDCKTTKTKVNSVDRPMTGEFQLDGNERCVLGEWYDTVDGEFFKYQIECIKNK